MIDGPLDTREYETLEPKCQFCDRPLQECSGTRICSGALDFQLAKTVQKS